MKPNKNHRNAGAWQFFLMGALVLLASIIATGCIDQGTIESPPPPPAPDKDGVLYDVAGIAGSFGKSGDGGPSTEARLYWPQDVCIAPNGDLWIVDWNNHVYRKVSPDGIIHAGFGSGRHGDDFDGPVDQINLNHPANIAIGPDGFFYLSIWHNWKIKKIDPVTFMATTYVGTDGGFLDGPREVCQINLPSSVVWDKEGNMYISDQGNLRVRRLDVDGNVNAIAGQSFNGYRDGMGVLAKFSFSKGSDAYPGGKLDIDPTGQYLYIADQLNNRIRMLDIKSDPEFNVTTVVGTGVAGFSGDGGLAMDAELNYPCDVACTEAGVLFIADARNHAIRRVYPNGTVSTVAGTGVAGVSPNGTVATEAMLNLPSAVYWHESTKTLYICDTYNSQVKKVRIPS